MQALVHNPAGTAAKRGLIAGGRGFTDDSRISAVSNAATGKAGAGSWQRLAGNLIGEYRLQTPLQCAVIRR